MVSFQLIMEITKNYQLFSTYKTMRRHFFATRNFEYTDRWRRVFFSNNMAAPMKRMEDL